MGLKFAQFGDTHLGYRALRKMVGVENVRTRDTRLAYEQACSEIADNMEHLDFAIHTGDLFDMPKPNYRTISVAIAGLRKIAESGKPVVVVAGNHDTPRVKTAGSVYGVMREAMPKNVHFVSGYDIETLDIMVRTEHGAEEVRFICVPYGAMMMRDVKHTEPEGEPDHTVVVLHGTLEGAMPELEAMAGYDLSQADLKRLTGDRKVAHVAMGHLHTKGVIEPRYLYNGSTNRFGWSDKTAEPGWWKVKAEGETWIARRQPLVSRDMHELEPQAIDYKNSEDVEAERDRIAATIEREADYQTRRLTRTGEGEALAPLLKVEIECNRADYKKITNSLIGLMDGRSMWHLTIDRSKEGDMVIDFPAMKTEGAMTVQGLLESYKETTLVKRYGNVEGERIGAKMLEYLQRAEEERE